MSSVVDDIKSAFGKQNNALVKLILINVLVFLFLILLEFFLSFSASGKGIYNLISQNIVLIAPIKGFIYKPWTLITYFFTHFGFWHLISNMLFLYWFGNLIQEFLGSRKLLNIYILGGIAGGLFYMFVHNLFSVMPVSNNVGEHLVGASAAVFAIMFAAITLLPDYEFYLFGIVMIKIRYLAWFFLLISFIDPSSGISHAGGAFFGFLYVSLLQNGTDLGSPIENLRDWWSNLNKPKPAMKSPTRRPVSQTATPSVRSGSASNLAPDYFPDQDEIDAILDKIGKSGYESLTKEEKQKLYRASQKD